VVALFPDQPVLNVRTGIRALAGVAAAVCCAALAFQFALILRETTALHAMGAVRFPIPAALAVFASFLTFHINVIAAVIVICAAAGSTRFERAGRTRAAVAAYMIAGSIVFIFALQPYWHHRGSQMVVDMLLHYLMPVLYVGWWLAAAPKDRLRWRDPWVWLIYPAVYFLTLLAFVKFSGFYPYPLIDMRFLGAGLVAFNVAVVALIFLTCGFAVIAVARMIVPPKS